MTWYRGGGFYPGTGKIKEVGNSNAAGRNVNIPWPHGGFGDADYMAAFDLVLHSSIQFYAFGIVPLALSRGIKCWLLSWYGG